MQLVMQRYTCSSFAPYYAIYERLRKPIHCYAVSEIYTLLCISTLCRRMHFVGFIHIYTILMQSHVYADSMQPEHYTFLGSSLTYYASPQTQTILPCIGAYDAKRGIAAETRPFYA